MCVLSCFSHVWLCVTLWTIACQAPLSMTFSRQEYWSVLPCLLQGIFPTQGLNPHLSHWQGDYLPLVPPGSPQIDHHNKYINNEKFELLWELPKMWHKMNKCCWKNGANRFSWCRVAMNFQLVENTISVKCNKAKCNKMRYVCVVVVAV